MRIDNERKLDFDDVLIRPKRSTLSSRKDVSLERSYTFRNSKALWRGIPIIASNMDTVGTLAASQVLAAQGLMTWLHKFYTDKEIRDFTPVPKFTAVTVGEDYHKHEDMIPANDCVEFIRLDAANGYREEFVEALKEIREIYRTHTIFAGNVCTPEMTEELLLAGADVIVVGIGPGAQCETRLKTGIGYPQLSAIIECADAAHGLKGHIVADGGCKNPCDIVKAFAAGADFVALGTMLAGHTENTEQIVNKDGHPYVRSYKYGPIACEFTPDPEYTKQYAKVYGMSSKAAMDKHYGGMADHRASEGKESLIPFKGPIENTLKDILGSIRSACTYTGAASLKELSKRTTFVRIK